MTFSPHVLFRRGTLGLDALTGLVPARAWEQLAEAEELRARCAALAGPLEDGIHAAVPAASAEHRRDLLRVRRDIHNGRLPARPECTVVLPLEWRDAFARWRAAMTDAGTLLAEAEQGYAAELDAACC